MNRLSNTVFRQSERGVEIPAEGFAVLHRAAEVIQESGGGRFAGWITVTHEGLHAPIAY
jgi:hypothetical protein